MNQNNFSNLNNSNNLSCTNLPFKDKSCNFVPNVKCPPVISTIENVRYNTMHIEIYDDDQLYQPLISNLYSIPEQSESVPVLNSCNNQIPAQCHVSGSEKSEQNKLLMRQKFCYPRVDPEASEFVDKRTDNQKMASILRI